MGTVPGPSSRLRVAPLHRRDGLWVFLHQPEGPSQTLPPGGAPRRRRVGPRWRHRPAPHRERVGDGPRTGSSTWARRTASGGRRGVHFKPAFCAFAASRCAATSTTSAECSPRRWARRLSLPATEAHRATSDGGDAHVTRHRHTQQRGADVVDGRRVPTESSPGRRATSSGAPPSRSSPQEGRRVDTAITSRRMESIVLSRRHRGR